MEAQVITIGLMIFALALLEGLEIISKVPPLLHTPLMSGSNAISGITLVGSIVAAGAGRTLEAEIMGVLAVTFASINVFGGFVVTDRMLRMFKRG